MELRTKAWLVIALWCVIVFVGVETNKSLVVRWHEHKSVITRIEQPILFHGLTVALTAAGALVIALVFRGISKDADPTEVSPLTTTQPRRRGIWIALNLVLIALSIWVGYEELAFERLQKTNPDPIFCAAILVVTVIFAIGICGSAKTKSFAKPSWFRFPLNLRVDPLQTLFIGAWSFLGAFLGALIRVRESEPRSYWTAAAFGSAFLGLLIGQLIALFMYRNRIMSDDEMENQAR